MKTVFKVNQGSDTKLVDKKQIKKTFKNRVTISNPN